MEDLLKSLSSAAAAGANARFNNTIFYDSFFPNTTGNGSTAREKGCQYASANTYAAGSILVVLSLSFCCKFLHITVFRPFFKQPRISSDIIVGMIVGNLDFLYSFLSMLVPKFNLFAQIGMGCYLLALGVEMDPSTLIQKPTPEFIIAFYGIIVTFVVSAIVAPVIKLGSQPSVGFILILSLILAGTSSPVLTRIITNLNINKTDMGRLIIGAGIYSEMISMILISMALAFEEDSPSPAVNGLATILLIAIETAFLKKWFPILAKWLSDRNPEGKEMKGSDLFIFAGTMIVICLVLPISLNYSITMHCFLVGLAFPTKGRVTRMLVSKFNQIINFIYFPIFFCWSGALADFKVLKFDLDKFMGLKLFSLYIMAIIGKVCGAMFSGKVLGFDWTVAVAIAVFLNVKGYYHIFAAAMALESNRLGYASYIAVILFGIFTIMPVPWLVDPVVERAMKQSKSTPMAIQWVKPNTELRMLLCIHGPQNVPSMINIMEVSRGNTGSKIGAYVTDMIEINDCNSTMFIPDHNHQDPLSDGGVKMADESVVNMREHITEAILSYVENSGEGINVHRLLAISTFANMHQDLYNLAEAVQASLIILPYHRNQRKDGKMDNIHNGFRHVNRKVLRQSPCSVGLLVDRGIGSINKGSSSASSVTIKVAVVFIGGTDDREALAYASRISQHPGISLTVVRFLVDNSVEKISSRAKKSPAIRAMVEQELKLDDEYFAEFYQKKVAHGKVEYVEKHVVNAKETVAMLKALEAQYALFIVGRAGRVNCVLTAGMNDWEECPDLGPIGEILADSDFSTTASILVIQQHTIDEREYEFKVRSF